jgi:hypothetical protein
MALICQQLLRNFGTGRRSKRVMVCAWTFEGVTRHANEQ